MRIFTNMTALNANLYLEKAGDSTSQAIERLSSGYKINNSKDNAVGLAMSNRLQMQIKSLERAEQNANDGVSIVQTAEGALDEVHSMLQRMSELAVEASNDTYTDDDRAAIQSEINQLCSEIDRVCEDTDFNGKSLLDGTVSRSGFTQMIRNYTLIGVNGVSADYVSDGVDVGNYAFNILAAPERATYTSLGFAGATVPAAAEGTVRINGVDVNIKAGDTQDIILNKFREVQDKTEISVTTEAGKMVFTNNYYGSKNKLTMSCENVALANYLGIDTNINREGKDTNATVFSSSVGFSGTATVKSDGETLLFTDRGNFEMKLRVEADTYDEYRGTQTSIRLGYNVVSAGSMTIQLGAHEGQDMEINIPKVSTETLGINNVNVRTSLGAENAITSFKNAITQVSKIRAQLGAYQNRMESTISSIQISSENLTSSLSSIKDVNMASEMTTYTTQNIISQAATSMLAQANQEPEKVLQILQ